MTWSVPYSQVEAFEKQAKEIGLKRFLDAWKRRLKSKPAEEDFKPSVVTGRVIWFYDPN